eukprot:4022898-Pleurochrysis_carterae.AAC.2
MAHARAKIRVNSLKDNDNSKNFMFRRASRSCAAVATAATAASTSASSRLRRQRQWLEVVGSTKVAKKITDWGAKALAAALLASTPDGRAANEKCVTVRAVNVMRVS